MDFDAELVENDDKDGFAVRALDPAVNGEVCRATDQSLTNAYYGRTLSPREIAAGTVSNPQSEPLQQALGQASTLTR